MITFTKSYKTDDGQVFGSIEEAQQHELENLLCKGGEILGSTVDLSKYLVVNKDAIIDILTMSPNSKPKARAIHGGKKTRAPKTIITDANASIGSSINKIDNIAGLPTA